MRPHQTPTPFGCYIDSYPSVGARSAYNNNHSLIPRDCKSYRCCVSAAAATGTRWVGHEQSFEIPDIPVRWYTFKRRPVPTPNAPTLDASEEAAGDPSSAKNGDEAQATEGGDAESSDEGGEEEMPEEVLPPPPALKALYAQGVGNKFFLALGGWARGAIFECSWEVRHPLWTH